jgi:hypothetical protein
VEGTGCLDYPCHLRCSVFRVIITLQRHLISSILLVLEFVAFFYLGSPLALLDCPETYVSRSVRA